MWNDSVDGDAKKICPPYDRYRNTQKIIIELQHNRVITLFDRLNDTETQKIIIELQHNRVITLYDRLSDTETHKQ